MENMMQMRERHQAETSELSGAVDRKLWEADQAYRLRRMEKQNVYSVDAWQMQQRQRWEFQSSNHENDDLHERHQAETTELFTKTNQGFWEMNQAYQVQRMQTQNAYNVDAWQMQQRQLLELRSLPPPSAPQRVEGSTAKEQVDRIVGIYASYRKRMAAGRGARKDDE